MGRSLLELAVRHLSPAGLMRHFTPEELETLTRTWAAVARPEQLSPPGDWTTWLVLAGRGFGKTRTGAEFSNEKAAAMPGSRGYLAARTSPADTRDTMIEGESGILACSPPDFRPRFESSKRRVVWPNGSMAFVYSSEEPDQARGPQHHWGWADELAAWKKNCALWDQLQMGLRLGANPQQVVTTTPRPVAAIRELLKNPACVVTRGSTYDNRANLSPAFFRQIIRRYEGTRMGRQELGGELLEDVPGALWQRRFFDSYRVQVAPPLVRVVVGVDPATTSNPESDETGIVVVGLGSNGHAYVLEDATPTERVSPDTWARRVVTAFSQHQADRVIAETNNGGELVQSVLRAVDPNLPYKGIHANRGKRTRAEPVSALYEQGRVHHVGTWSTLEDEGCNWVPDLGADSPNRIDALVYAVRALIPVVDLDDKKTKQQPQYDPGEREFVEQDQGEHREWVP